MKRMLRLLLRRPLLIRRRTQWFYARCIPFGDGGSASVLLPTPPWWKEVSDKERPEFERRYDEFYRLYPGLIEFQPPRPGTKEYEQLQEDLARGFSGLFDQ